MHITKSLQQTTCSSVSKMSGRRAAKSTADKKTRDLFLHCADRFNGMFSQLFPVCVSNYRKLFVHKPQIEVELLCVCLQSIVRALQPLHSRQKDTGKQHFTEAWCMIRRESSIDFPQLCLLRLPLLNMDSVQLPSWLCLEIDTLSTKGYSFFNKAPCQERDQRGTGRDCFWFALEEEHQCCRLSLISTSGEKKRSYDGNPERRMWSYWLRKGHFHLRLFTLTFVPVFTSYRTKG